MTPRTSRGCSSAASSPVARTRDCSSINYTVSDGSRLDVPDWAHRAEYIRSRSTRKESIGETDIEPAWADEAFTDPLAVVFSPDPASKGGQSDRTIGWSSSAGFVITVITVNDGAKVWGANAWKASDCDLRRYERQEEDHE